MPSEGEAPLRPGRIIGGFLGVFGSAVLIAIAFTPTGRGKIVNLICGATLIGAALLFRSIRDEDETDGPGRIGEP